MRLRYIFKKHIYHHKIPKDAITKCFCKKISKINSHYTIRFCIFKEQNLHIDKIKKY